MMSRKSIKPTDTSAWKALQKLADIRSQKLNDEKSQYFLEGFLADFTRTEVKGEIKSRLLDLAKECGLHSHIEEMLSGDLVNLTENRAVGHIFLRSHTFQNIFTAKAQRELKRMSVLCEDILMGKKVSSTGEAFTHMVNIGIGGSDLGPAMASTALKDYHTHLKVAFVSNVDAAGILDIMEEFPAERTLFIISSKTFTTQESLQNADSAKEWLRKSLKKEDVSAHFFGVTASPQTAESWGILPENILEFWDWVGGRFSIWSSIGFSLALSIGWENFQDFLKGAAAMDTHFLETPWEENIPILLALHGIWNRNFRHRPTLACLPYAERLRLFPSYLQQLDMESNGKNIDVEGKHISYKTAPVLWGSSGTNSQHAYMQMMHQGTDVVPAEFIGFIRQKNQIESHQEKLLANMVAQAEALAYGEEPIPEKKHQYFRGETPSVILLFDVLNPYYLGMLLSLYEHKIFVQGSIWNINSFDQFGVELGKKLAKNYLTQEDHIPGIFSYIKQHSYGNTH